MTGMPARTRWAVTSTIGPPPSSLTALAPALLEHPDRGRQRLRRAVLVGPEGQVADDQRVSGAPGHGAGVVEHLVERDGHGRVVAEHDHAEAVADEQHGDPELVEQRGASSRRRR
jgi:hypothetical protein